MIPIIPYIPPQEKGQKPNIAALAMSIFLLFGLALSLGGFILLNGMSFSITFVILGIILLIAASIPMIVALESRQSQKRVERPVRYVARPYQPSNPTWDDYSQDKRKYCVECGSLVENSDFFCATCGSRLEYTDMQR